MRQQTFCLDGVDIPFFLRPRMPYIKVSPTFLIFPFASTFYSYVYIYTYIYIIWFCLIGLCRECCKIKVLRLICAWLVYGHWWQLSPNTTWIYPFLSSFPLYLSIFFIYIVLFVFDSSHTLFKGRNMAISHTEFSLHPHEIANEIFNFLLGEKAAPTEVHEFIDSHTQGVRLFLSFPLLIYSILFSSLLLYLFYLGRFQWSLLDGTEFDRGVASVVHTLITIPDRWHWGHR